MSEEPTDVVEQPSHNSVSSPASNCEDCCSLEKQVSDLKQEVEELKTKLQKTDKQLKKAEFERDSSAKYVESFREQVSELHKKLDAEKKRNASLEGQLKQTIDSKDDWSSARGTGSDGIGTDIASSIREAAKDIASSIRDAAQQATTNNGFVYDEKTGLYYDYNTGYYYDPNTRLYYDYQKGIYYTYDQDKGTYHFYSQVAVSVAEPAADDSDEEGIKGDKRGDKSTAKVDKRNITKVEVVETGSEDGEIIDLDEDEDDNDVKEENEDDKSDKEEEFPPCIRAIVLQSDKIPVGSLNIITCMGITFGRAEGSGNILRISDVEVSKEHAKIHYDKDSHEYFLTDLGSQNGTFVNGTRLSESKVTSEPRKLAHGEQLKLGATTLLLHIHPGNETCNECEPGQVQAQLKAKEVEDEIQITRVVTAVHDKDANALRKKELKRLKKRYMLQNSDHEVNAEIASNVGKKYKDRAHVRRKKVGSDVPSSKINAAPSSVFKPIKSENKGRLMLEKMGWADGEGLGKTKSGRTEPVIATVRKTGSGLGYGGLESIDMISQNPKSAVWRKAQERYNAADLVDSEKTTPNKNSGKGKNEQVDIFADTDNL